MIEGYARAPGSTPPTIWQVTDAPPSGYVLSQRRGAAREALDALRQRRQAVATMLDRHGPDHRLLYTLTRPGEDPVSVMVRHRRHLAEHRSKDLLEATVRTALGVRDGDVGTAHTMKAEWYAADDGRIHATHYPGGLPFGHRSLSDPEVDRFLAYADAMAEVATRYHALLAGPGGRGAADQLAAERAVPCSGFPPLPGSSRPAPREPGLTAGDLRRERRLIYNRNRRYLQKPDHPLNGTDITGYLWVDLAGAGEAVEVWLLERRAEWNPTTRRHRVGHALLLRRELDGLERCTIEDRPDLCCGWLRGAALLTDRRLVRFHCKEVERIPGLRPELGTRRPGVSGLRPLAALHQPDADPIGRYRPVPWWVLWADSEGRPVRWEEAAPPNLNAQLAYAHHTNADGELCRIGENGQDSPCTLPTTDARLTPLLTDIAIFALSGRLAQL